MDMLTKVRPFVKDHLDDIILALMVALVSLFSFALGYLTAQQQKSEPIRIETPEEYQNPSAF